MGNGEREDDRKLAVWLDIICLCDKDKWGMSVHGYGSGTGRCYKCGKQHEWPNFRTDEAANAMLLEKAKIHLWPTDGSPGGDGWAAVSYLAVGRICYDKDRKTAIVLAALALLNERGRG